MDSVQVSLLVLGLVLILGTQYGESIECMVCNSALDGQEACMHQGDDFSSADATAFKKNCDTEANGESYQPKRNYTVCRKMKQTVDGKVRIVRQCGTNWDESKPCVDRTGSDGIKVSYCECNDDGCNSALMSAPMMLLTALSALMALLLHS